MLSMVSGSVGFAPNPIDGLTFFLEPTRPLAATIVDNADGLSVEPFGQTLYAFAAILLVSAMFLSLAGWAAKQPLKKYGRVCDEQRKRHGELPTFPPKGKSAYPPGRWIPASRGL